MSNNKILIALALAGCMSLSSMQAFIRTNFSRPFDYVMRMPHDKEASFTVGIKSIEYGSRSTGRDRRDNRRNILQLCHCLENALAMLSDPLPDVQERINMNVGDDILRSFIQINEDNGKQGQIAFSAAEFNGLNVNFFASYVLPFDKIPGTLALSLYVPVVWREITGVCIKDLTVADPVNPELGHLVKLYLTDNLANNVKNWGCLDLGSFQKSGIGDVSLLLEWHKRFRQEKEYLKAVTLFLKGGLMAGTSKKRNEDKAFALPLGSDGHWGFPVGIGIQLQFLKYVLFGIDADFLILLDESRNFRMKTDRDQTDFLLLNKGRARRESGLIWQFHLYVQAYHFWRGLSAKVAYQFVKHDDDRLSPRCNNFDFALVNNMCRLRESTIHNLIFWLNYDCFEECKKWWLKPQMSVFYKLPIAGKNVLDNWTVGGQLALNF